MARKINPTLRNKGVAKDIKQQLATKQYKTLGETLGTNGYSSNVIKHHTADIMAQPGMKKALADEGISVQMADEVVKNIMLSPIVYEMVTPDNQLRATDQIYKRLGAYAPEKLEVRKVVAHITFNKPKDN